MKRQRRNSGFTMMELLIVVGIIGILAAVSFVAVQSHQKNVTRLEQDAIAKEIFIAAQNHITLARSEGYMGLADSQFGKLGTEEADKKDNSGGVKQNNNNIYYIAVNVNKDVANASNMLDQILPRFAIDETVRHGNYIIRYQPSSGIVLDVFYATPAERDSRYGYNLTEADYVTLMGSIYKDDGTIEENAHSKLIDIDGKVVGWYGGAEAASMAHLELKAPTIEIENGARLLVKVTDPNKVSTASNDEKKSTLLLTITGDTSGASKKVVLRNNGGTTTSDDRIKNDTDSNVYTYILDDITSDAKLHFAEIVSDETSKPFFPGENITVKAEVYSQNMLSNIAVSNEETTNSLFEKLELDKKVDINATKLNKVSISDIRHLENLHRSVSGFMKTAGDDRNPKAIAITDAVQTTDISWKGFVDEIKRVNNVTTVAVFETGKTTASTTNDCFFPVKLDYTLNYNGYSIRDNKAHNITDVKVNTTGNAGLFSEIPSGCKVSNLALIDFSITSTGGDAGALAGTLAQSEALGDGVSNVSNVVAYNSNSSDANKIVGSGSTGGLIGSVTGGLIGSVTGGYAKIEKSAAALLVESTGGNAGGLIGTIDGGTVTACYSGGHTDNGYYYKYDATKKAPDYTKPPKYNVVATAGIAGGLIGEAVNMGDITNSYSTCSVKGATAGGFVGTYEGADTEKKISNCYATGLVAGTADETDPVTDEDGTSLKIKQDGAFAYSVSKAENCKYFEIINERVKRDTSVAGGNKEATIYPTTPDTDTSKNTYVYLTALGKNDKTSTGITALDADATSYEGFVGAPATWKTAIPYDAKLLEYYSVKDASNNNISSFNLKGIPSLDSSVTGDYFVSRHYGDWPAPEIFVFNTAS